MKRILQNTTKVFNLRVFIWLLWLERSDFCYFQIRSQKNQTKFAPYEIMRKNLKYINSAPSSSTIEVTLTLVLKSLSGPCIHYVLCVWPGPWPSKILAGTNYIRKNWLHFHWYQLQFFVALHLNATIVWNRHLIVPILSNHCCVLFQTKGMEKYLIL